jgi:hypothetical protein
MENYASVNLMIIKFILISVEPSVTVTLVDIFLESLRKKLNLFFRPGCRTLFLLSLLFIVRINRKNMSARMINNMEL